jgi:mRNA-degrading endonuclease toxin of MazEF toxin-antitoxin module
LTRRAAPNAGPRPVVVISAVPMGPRFIVVPMTTQRRDWPTRIHLSLHGVDSDAMCEQVRTINASRLSEDLHGNGDADTLSEIRRTVARLIGVY